MHNIKFKVNIKSPPRYLPIATIVSYNSSAAYFIAIAYNHNITISIITICM